MPSRKNTKAPEAQDWMSRIRESSHDVYLAGLASLARARSTKSGSEPADFDRLVAEGRKLEPQVKASMQRAFDEIRERSRPSLGLRPEGRLQSVFEERVAAVLARLGVPNRKEMLELSAKVDRLLAERKTPGKTAKTAAAPRARKSPARTATKK